MRAVRAALVVLIVGAGHPYLAAQELPPSSVVIFDRDMTPAAGTSDLLALQHALIFVEDRFLPAQFDETTSLRRTIGIAYRFGKWFALDLPQDHFLMVVAHEVFGHGARLREIGATDIHYHFDVPIPYGPGGGSTEFNGDVPATRGDVLAIDTAGIEAQNVLADGIGRHALASGTLTYRESWMYLESRLDGLRYIRSVSPQSPPGHDVADFLNDFNDGCIPPVCTPLDESTLKQRALWMLADPMLAYAAYDMFVTYMVRGQISGTVPMIPLPHDLKYLPAVRFEMAPYGTEWTSEHDIVGSGRLTRVSLRFGDTGRSLAWGIGVLATDLVHVGRVAAQASAEVWRQPPLDAPPSSTALATGGLAAATFNVALGGSADRPSQVGLVLQGGYKSDGYVRGERLHAGPIVRVGLSVTLDRAPRSSEAFDQH